MTRPLRVFLSAGEASGDRFASRLVRALRRLRPDTVFEGIGGRHMAAEGVERIADLTQHAVMGFTAGLRNISLFLSVYRRFISHLNRRRPDVFVPVDNPGFHLKLAALAHGRGVPVVYYVSPQVWAWGRRRIHRVAARVSRVLCILPFEKQLYDAIGADAVYVGHPSLDYLAEAAPDPEATRQLRALSRPLVGLLPGSRRQEVRNVFPIIAGAAGRLRRRDPNVSFVVGCAEASHEAAVRARLRREGIADALLLTGRAWDVMRESHICLAASGTATLELAWYRRPMVIVYRAPGYARHIMPRILRTNFGLVNIVAGREVCPEFLMYDDEPGPVTEAAWSLLNDEAKWEEQRRALEEVMGRVGEPGAADRAAEAVIEIAERRRRR